MQHFPASTQRSPFPNVDTSTWQLLWTCSDTYGTTALLLHVLTCTSQCSRISSRLPRMEHSIKQCWAPAVPQSHLWDMRSLLLVMTTSKENGQSSTAGKSGCLVKCVLVCYPLRTLTAQQKQHLLTAPTTQNSNSRELDLCQSQRLRCIGYAPRQLMSLAYKAVYSLQQRADYCCSTLGTQLIVRWNTQHNVLPTTGCAFLAGCGAIDVMQSCRKQPCCRTC